VQVASLQIIGDIQRSPLDRIAHRVHRRPLHVCQIKPGCVAMSEQRLVEALNCALYIPLVCSAYAYQFVSSVAIYTKQSPRGANTSQANVEQCTATHS